MKYKFKNIFKKSLLTGDKFMSVMHLKQPRFTCSSFASFTGRWERIKKFRETGELKYIYL